MYFFSDVNKIGTPALKTSLLFSLLHKTVERILNSKNRQQVALTNCIGSQPLNIRDTGWRCCLLSPAEVLISTTKPLQDEARR